MSTLHRNSKVLDKIGLNTVCWIHAQISSCGCQLPKVPWGTFKSFLSPWRKLLDVLHDPPQGEATRTIIISFGEKGLMNRRFLSPILSPLEAASRPAMKGKRLLQTDWLQRTLSVPLSGRCLHVLQQRLVTEPVFSGRSWATPWSSGRGCLRRIIAEHLHHGRTDPTH